MVPKEIAIFERSVIVTKLQFNATKEKVLLSIFPYV